MSTGSRAGCVGWGNPPAGKETGQMPQRKTPEIQRAPKRGRHMRVSRRVPGHHGRGRALPLAPSLPVGLTRQCQAPRSPNAQTVALPYRDREAQTEEKIRPHCISHRVPHLLCLSPCITVPHARQGTVQGGLGATLSLFLSKGR